ncbi:MAG: tetratricopeptide repeat protein [Bacteroidetes Order II. Incertae sedis bacterium]|nr:tetratricopeptide repeat protein [Bacteroidetes Order II. bacterium]
MTHPKILNYWIIQLRTMNRFTTHISWVLLPFLVLGMFFFVAACQTGSDDADLSSAPNPFKNLGASFVGDESCATCHEDLVARYESHGMANSFYALTDANTVENFGTAPIFHEATGYYYRPFREGGKFFQEEYRMENGEKTTSLIREMNYVVGSGTAARTYITVENGRHYELPLTWYTQEKKWSFSPGYQEKNARFSREIPDRCMACHNSYPESVPFVEGKYTKMPQGISCERCHGPGSLHVEERTADPDIKGTDYTIVNPKHLSLDRRLDVCQQCHLHGPVSLLREGVKAFDFRPSMVLSTHVSVFKVANADANGQISVVSHADRMKESACFIGAISTKKPMDCTTCHDPHEGFRKKGTDYFNKQCLSCHPAAALPAKVAVNEKTNHQTTSNCISCHMPKTQTADAPHSSFTDHLVRVVRSGKVRYEESVKTGPIELKPHFPDKSPEADIYAGMAYMVYGRRMDREDLLQKGIDLLRERLPNFPKMGEAMFSLGYALFLQGAFDEAISWMEKANAQNSGIPERLNGLAQAYEAAGRPANEAEKLYRKALEIQPAAANIRTNLGRLLETQGRLNEAIEAYKAAVVEDPWQTEANYNLGTLFFKQNNAAEAEKYLLQAVRLNPDHLNGLGNLGVLFAKRGALKEAEQMFRRTTRLNPNNAAMLNNLASLYIQTNRFAEAKPLLEQSAQLVPNNAATMGTLAAVYYQIGRKADAVAMAKRTLTIDPSNGMAQQVLQAP